MPITGMNTFEKPQSNEFPGSPAEGSWVTEAIASQEEYIKRIHSCSGVVGLPHAWDRFAAAPGVYYSACTRCRVTETQQDYKRKLKST